MCFLFVRTMGEGGERKKTPCLFSFSSSTIVLGSFSNDDGDGNENAKKATGLLSKTTSLHVHHPFLDISLPLLHDYG